MGFLTTADGLQLESELAVPPSPVAAAVLAHPHPQFGGDMRALVTGELFARLPAAGIACLRFNFRGVGASEGTHDDGKGERLDVAAAVAALAGAVPDVPLVLSGYSFGADVCTAVADDRLAAWVLVAAPLAIVPVREMVVADDPRPKLLLVPEHDQYRSPDSAREATAAWVNTTVEAVPGADHFMAGRTAVVADRFTAFTKTLL
jgi:alpha/beta superfamily hydrolase